MKSKKKILNLEERISELEKRIENLEKQLDVTPAVKPARGTYTEKVINYIQKSIADAKEQGLHSLTLTSGTIQKEVGLRNRLPLVCNAMRKCMNDKSEIIHETPSGQSSTFTVKWKF